MAEKEERIVCRVIEKGYGCDYCFSRPAHRYYQCSISNNDCTYDMCKQCSLGMTRQEAIERIAKEIARQYDPRKPNKEDYEKVWKQELFTATKKYYLKQAECVLNALLEGK